MPAVVPIGFLVLMAGAIFPPFIPLAGPLSADDIPSLVAVAFACALIPFSRRRPILDPTVIGFALLAVFAVISSAANAHNGGDFARLLARSAGRLVYFQALLVGARLILAPGDWAPRAVGFVIGAATLQSLFCIYSFVARYHGPYGLGAIGFAEWSVLAGRVRVQGTFGGVKMAHESAVVSANFLAAYLVMTIPATLGFAAWVTGRWWRVVVLASAVAQIVTLYITYTRAALVAFAGAILVMGFLSGRRALSIALLTLAIAATLSIPSVRNKFLNEGHDRWALYWASAEITRDHAVFGVGDGRYDQVLHQEQRYNDTPYGIAAATSHNSVLLSAAHYGILGGAAHATIYVLLFVFLLRELYGIRNDKTRILTSGVAAGVIGYLAQDQLNNLAYVPKVATQMWFMVALVPLLARRPATPDDAPQGVVLSMHR